MHVFGAGFCEIAGSFRRSLTLALHFACGNLTEKRVADDAEHTVGSQV